MAYYYQAQTPVRYYGAKPDNRDPRDRKRVYEYHEIPRDPAADLRRFVPQIYYQDSLGSCTANAVCAAYGIDLVKQSRQLRGQGYHYFEPSRLFVYYNTREKEGTVSKDVGASIREAVKALNKSGVCTESAGQIGSWPYDVSKFARKPPQICYTNAQGNTLCEYERLDQDMEQFRACLKNGYPIVFGFKIFRSFESIESSGGSAGVMPMPSKYERQSPNKFDGRHAVVAVGYDDKAKMVIVLNSWGSSWGDGGYFYMPYDFIIDDAMCFDFWKITFACERGAKR